MSETIEMTLSDLARDCQKFMAYSRRDSGEGFYHATDDAPEWFRELCRDAHGEYLPDDYRYKWISHALDAFADYDNAEEAINDCEPEPYHSQLLSWVSSNLYRMGYVDEAISGFGCSTLSDALALGQAEEMRETYYSVMESLDKRLAEIGDE